MDARFKARVEAKQGVRINRQIYSIQQNSGIKGLEKVHAGSIPDAMSRSGRPIELKPDSRSGRRAMETQIKRYEHVTDRRGIRAYYDTAGKISYKRTPWSEYRERPGVRVLRPVP